MKGGEKQVRKTYKAGWNHCTRHFLCFYSVAVPHNYRIIQQLRTGNIATDTGHRKMKALIAALALATVFVTAKSEVRTTYNYFHAILLILAKECLFYELQ